MCKKRFWLILNFIIVLSLTLSGCYGSDVESSGSDDSNYITEQTENDVTYEDEYTVADYNDLLEYVDSSCFDSVGYDDYEEILYVKFLNSGSVYAYYGVPYGEYEELVYADSIGGYYNDHIKGQYDSERLE